MVVVVFYLQAEVRIGDGGIGRVRGTAVQCPRAAQSVPVRGHTLESHRRWCNCNVRSRAQEMSDCSSLYCTNFSLHLSTENADDDDEVMLNVLRCQLTY